MSPVRRGEESSTSYSMCRVRNIVDFMRSWARWVLQGKLSSANGQDIAADDFLQKVAAAIGMPQVTPAALPAASSCSNPLVSSMVHQQHNSNCSNHWNQFGLLIRWRSEGWVSEAEFETAKSMMGL